MSNIFLRALDAAVGAVAGAPEMANRPPRVSVEGPRRDEPSSFRGVSQSGTLDALAQAEPLSDRARAELHPRILPAPARDPLTSVPWPTPQQQAAFDKFLAEKGHRTPASLVTKLGELDRAWLNLQTAISECAASQNARYHEHLASIAGRVEKGDQTAHDADAWTRQDWFEDSREKLSVFKTAAKRIEAEAWGLARPALLAKSALADELADELEVAARPLFEKFNTPFHPASYMLALRKYALSLRDDSRSGRGKPSAMIEEL